MWSPVERMKVALSVRLGWRVPGQEAEAVRGFQATEADGVWHLHRALRHLKDPKQRAIVFTHGLEEESHADEFTAVYKEVSDTAFTPPQFEREDLYGKDDPVWKTFAFVHVGEEDATQRFRFLHDSIGPGPLKSSLGKIIEDESGHVDLTYQMLKKFGAKDGEIRREYLRVRLGRAWERWLRMGKRVVDVVATVLLSAVYYAIGPFVAGVARRRLRNRVVEFDNSHLKRL